MIDPIVVEFDVTASPGHAFEVWTSKPSREPPDRVGYLWHLFFDRSQATEITVTFTGTESGSRVTLVQTGFDKLGPEVRTERRRRTNHAWLEITGLYRDAL